MQQVFLIQIRISKLVVEDFAIVFSKVIIIGMKTMGNCTNISTVVQMEQFIIGLYMYAI